MITFKWQQWARRWMHAELAMYLVWLLAFQIFVFIFQVRSGFIRAKHLLGWLILHAQHSVTLGQMCSTVLLASAS